MDSCPQKSKPNPPGLAFGQFREASSGRGTGDMVDPPIQVQGLHHPIAAGLPAVIDVLMLVAGQSSGPI